MKEDIKTYNIHQLNDLMPELGEKPFRTKQLLEWLYSHRASSFDDMTNLSKKLREQLNERFYLHSLKIVNKRVSKDGTRKYLMELNDGQVVETVAIPGTGQKDRLTICFSTQVGCAMACAFCATGHEGFTRNLGMGEMVDQILIAQDDMGQRVSNIVAMGQGEPFLNYQNVVDALKVLNDKKLVGIGARHITVSTCGIIPGIEQFSTDPHQYTMAVSLHAAIQSKRDDLMPKVRKFPLNDLKEALISYVEQTNRRVTFEYLMMRDINDTKEDLKALISFCDGILCHINLLPVNDIEGSPYKPTSKQNLQYWMQSLEKAHIEATLRTSRGSDIEGACGQLKNAIQ